MDHKWGRNITEYSLGDLGASMCSRWRRRAGAWEVVINKLFFGQVHVFVVPDDNQFAIGDFVSTAVPPGTHFPYGFPVEHDAPV